MASQPERFRRAYRIASPNYPLLDGGGSHRWGSRWCSPGRWVVHAAETYALAVLENLVHWRANTLPPSLVIVEIRLPARLSYEYVDPAEFPGWNDPDYAVSRRIGDDWYDRAQSVALWVPSIVSPYECNALFNRMHPDFARIETTEPQRVSTDPRLWTRSG